ncbi:MAG: rRNA maturation RNase YbeY [Bacteroidota bacterium]
MSKVHFQNSNLEFEFPLNKKEVKGWIARVIADESYELEELSIVFTSDDSLLEINKTYLNHDTYTDIITFDYSEKEKSVMGEILISIDRVKENAQKYAVDFTQELARVIIHGVIHLLGYEDKSPNQKAIMRKKEDACISLLKI